MAVAVAVAVAVARRPFGNAHKQKRRIATNTCCYIKDMGKSSSRQLRRAIYYPLYRMDPQKTVAQK